MKNNRYYHLAIVALLAVGVCVALSASRWLTAAFTTLCCQFMAMSEGYNTRGWSLGMMLLLGLFGLGLWTLAKRLWKTHQFVSNLWSTVIASPPERIAALAAALKISNHVVVLRTETPLAFCFGLLWPRICVSTGLAGALNDKELKAVLLHEDLHRRHYDPLRTLLAEAMSATFFFLPIAAELRDLFLTSMELAADRHATGVMGRPALAGALHKTLTHPLANHLASSTGIIGLSATKARLAELLEDRPILIRPSASNLILTSAIIMLGCMLAQNPLF